MDATLRSVINNALGAFLEPLNKGDVELSLAEGVQVRGLRVKPAALNYMLEKNGVDLRVEDGRVGDVRVAYSALPGTVTLQLSQVDIRVRPHAMKTVGKALIKGLSDLVTTRPQCFSEDACRRNPLYAAGSPVIYEPDPYSGQWVESSNRGLCGLAGPSRRQSPRRLPTRIYQHSPPAPWPRAVESTCPHCAAAAAYPRYAPPVQVYPRQQPPMRQQQRQQPSMRQPHVSRRPQQQLDHPDYYYATPRKPQSYRSSQQTPSLRRQASYISR